MQQRLPPLKALVAFESVVRRGSVTAAAEELFVTHSAVSKQIAALEDWIGEPLFAENRRAMLPTPAALRLADSVGMALKLISKSLEVFSEKSESVLLRVIAPSTFAMRWLLPRLPGFQSRHRLINVRVRQTHTPESWHDIPFDLAIRRGGPVPGYLKSLTILREELGLVCRPDLVDADDLRSAGEVAKAVPLLRADTRPGELENWLQVASAPVRLATQALGFPHFYIALEAALAGAGAVVAPILVIEELLHRRDLVEPFPDIRLQGPEYVALYDENAAEDSPQAVFAQWLAAVSSAQPAFRTNAGLPQSMDDPWQEHLRP